MSELDLCQSLEQSLSKEAMQNPADVLFRIDNLVKSISQKIYNLDENNPGDKKALELDVKFVNIRPKGDSLITIDDLGERYSFALDRGIFYLYEKCVSKVSKDGERDEWKELFRGDRSQLEEVSDKDKIIKVTIELGTALLAVLGQLKASKSA